MVNSELMLPKRRCSIRLAMKDKIISFKIEHVMKAKLLVLAKAESRSLSNFIDKVLREEIRKYEAQHGRIKVPTSE